MAETAKAGSGLAAAGGGSAAEYERHSGKEAHHSRRGGGSGGRGGRQRRDGKRGGGGGGGGGGFDPHAAIAPKILVKRPVLLPDTPTELSQPSQPQSERTLFVPTLSSSSSAASAAAAAASSAFAAAGRREQRAPHSATLPPPRQSSPGVSIASAPALSALSSPMRLLSSSFRLAGLEQLERLLSDQAAPFTVISAVGMQQAGKSSVLNALMLRSGEGGGAGFAVGSKEGAGGSGGKGGQQHATQGVEIVASPERVLYIDTQPLLSPPPAAVSHREDAGSGSAFLAAVSAEMLDLQMPLLLLALSHVLLVTVTWPIPQPLVAHLRAVFALYAALAPSLQPPPQPPAASSPASLSPSLPLARCAEVVLLINKLSESSADSPQAIHSAVSSLFPSAPFPLSGQVGNGGGGAGAGRLNLFVLPWRERGSLHESSMRELRSQLLWMRKDGGGGGVRGSERDWLRRLQTAWSCIAHSPLMREERRRIERKMAALHAPPAAFNLNASAASSTLQQQHGHAGAQQQQSRRAGVPRGDASDDLYHRDAPPSSHHYRLYQPPG